MTGVAGRLSWQPLQYPDHGQDIEMSVLPLNRVNPLYCPVTERLPLAGVGTCHARIRIGELIALTTVLAFAAPDADNGLAAAIDTVAELAHADELLVVYGHGEPSRGQPPGDPRGGRQLTPSAFVAALRACLPRREVVAVLVDADGEPRRAEYALLEELLDVGVLPVVVTSTPDAGVLATHLAARLHADRVLSWSRGSGFGVRA